MIARTIATGITRIHEMERIGAATMSAAIPARFSCSGV